jgi:hypothetical protein
VFGSIALEVADVHEPGPLPPESDRIAGRHTAFSATPSDAFPHSAAAARTMAEYVSTRQYLWVCGGSSTASHRATAASAAEGLPSGQGRRDGPGAGG